ncbi:hypothetical protein [Mesorhizobium sp. M7A.F.Ca.CA.004.02.1.1]|uniref:hypothetical protein n=1 Tax=Mesorhizobium sp. M7A.F.Ca.CA.004.02.1.1 TaxID=2496690 RepID=UPI000FCC47D3|nr:hypothetical protein [Mesorhizobium sp. M7A.F.Ca.CA.004.02.1.1]RVB05674.1 hypothetical protein EN912_02105 [Mesorhizobium sp. M7A.F.Ca.CA.004.02.1.1]
MKTDRELLVEALDHIELLAGNVRYALHSNTTPTYRWSADIVRKNIERAELFSTYCVVRR